MGSVATNQSGIPIYRGPKGADQSFYGQLGGRPTLRPYPFFGGGSFPGAFANRNFGMPSVRPPATPIDPGVPPPTPEPKITVPKKKFAQPRTRPPVSPLHEGFHTGPLAWRKFGHAGFGEGGPK